MFFALVLSSCSSGGGTSLEQTLVDQEWEILNGTERLFLNSDDGILYSKENTCDDFIAEGTYLFSENELYISYTTGSLEVTELYGEIQSFSIEEFSFVLYEDSTSLELVNEVFVAVEPVIMGCTLDIASNYNPEAECDDGSCIYEPLAIGDFYQGGIIFYIDSTGFHGKIAARRYDFFAVVGNADEQWGCGWNDPSFGGDYIDGTSTSFGSGASNTQAIVESCSTPSAARVCHELVLNNYSDWYLPSLHEIDLIAENLSYTGIAPYGVISSADYWHWTSSQVSASSAHGYKPGHEPGTIFTDGTIWYPGIGEVIQTLYKSQSCRIVPVRDF